MSKAALLVGFWKGFGGCRHLPGWVGDAVGKAATCV